MMGVLVGTHPSTFLRRASEPAAVPRMRLVQAEAEPLEVVMDLSRLMSRVVHSTPTGIDRVEMAWAQGLLRRIPERLRFAGMHPAGFYSSLSNASVMTFLDEICERWTYGAGNEGRFQRWREVWRKSLAIRPAWPVGRRKGPRVYLHLSPRGLERRDAYRTVLARENAKLVCFVHDLIPAEHPQYSASSSVALFQRRLATMLELADGFLVNSQFTAASLAAACQDVGRNVPLQVAPLGISRLERGTASLAPKPYFVVLSTIEPRKNHLLLLQVWQRLAASLPAREIPELVIVGRRGWDIENISTLLDRCPALRPFVREEGRLPDTRMSEILSGATALLAPSFIEGYGLPVAEALALGVPVIASDIPAHREVGRHVPEYLDPLDGPKWQQAVIDYSQPISLRALSQRARLAGWRPQTWDRHIDDALSFFHTVTSQDPS